MKRREYLADVRKQAEIPGGCIVLPVGMRLSDLLVLGEVHDAGDLAEGFALWMERQGHEWEPEEEWRLPDSIVATKVVDCDGLHLLPRTPGKPLTEDQVRRIYEAAESAYNSENRYMRVVERALVEARSATPSFERILAILEEREELEQVWPEEVSMLPYPLEGESRRLLSLTPEASDEVARRWREEPRLRDQLRRFTEFDERAASDTHLGRKLRALGFDHQEAPDGLREAVNGAFGSTVEAQAAWSWLRGQILPSKES